VQTKMKFLFTTTFMFVTFAFAFMAETTHLSNQRDKSENVSLMDIIQSVLNDPEFLALSSKQQLHVLIVMYNAIEAHYNKQGFIDKKKV
jgi:hypothetical protein